MALVALTVSLLLPSPALAEEADGDAQDTSGTMPPLAPVNPDATATPTNLLVIDGTTGLVKEWRHNGADLTDIRVTHVAPSTGGFQLRDPYGHIVFQNQSSTSDGFVEFWHQDLVSGGLYLVTQGDFDATRMVPVDDGPVVEFTAPAMTPAVTADQVLNLLLGGSSSSVTTTKISQEVKWANLLVVTAPYGGSATASAGWTKAIGAYLIGGFSSSHETQNTISTDNGKTNTFNQLGYWGYYQEHHHACSQGDCYDWDVYYAKVFDWKPNGTDDFRTIWIYNNQRTDADDATSFHATAPSNGADYPSVVWDARYQTRDGSVDTTTGGGTTKTVSNQMLFSIGASISIGGYGVTFDAFQASANVGSSSYYTYSFPSGSVWRMDYLRGTNSNSATAFCRAVDGVTCA